MSEETNNSEDLSNILGGSIEFEYVDVYICNCSPEIAKLEGEIEAYNTNNERLNKEYYEKLISNLKKDLAIRELKKKIREHNSQFNEFRKEFSPSAIEELESMIGDSTKDSTFVLKAMKFLYNNELTRLKGKTYSGRSKEPITPEKIEILKRLLTKRIDIEEKNGENAVKRKLNFSKHVKTGIESINKLQIDSEPNKKVE